MRLHCVSTGESAQQTALKLTVSAPRAIAPGLPWKIAWEIAGGIAGKIAAEIAGKIAPGLPWRIAPQPVPERGRATKLGRSIPPENG